METRIKGSLRLVESEVFRPSEKTIMLHKAQRDARVRGIEVRRVSKGRLALVLAYDIEADTYL